MFKFIDLPRPRKRLIQLMYDASQKTEAQEKSFDIIFLRTPISILGASKIEGIELAVNRLEGKYYYYIINNINNILLILYYYY